MLIYTDGSALNNSKDAPAGWACLFVFSNGKTLLRSGGQRSTNNAAEIQAISYALWYSVNKLTLKDEELLIKSDSEYAIKVISGVNKAKANAKAIAVCKMLIQKLKSANVDVKFEHVMAHTGGTDDDSKYNDIVDKEARKQATLISEEKTDKKCVYISKKIPKYQIFTKLFKEDDYIVKDFDINEVKDLNIRFRKDMLVIYFDEYADIRALSKGYYCWIISHYGATYDIPIYMPCLEVCISQRNEKFIKYGSFARGVYCCAVPSEEVAYKWFYDCNARLFNRQILDPIPGLLFDFTADMFYNKLTHLNDIFTEEARNHKIIIKSNELKPIAHGVFNIIYDISSYEPDSIIRIHSNPETPFDVNACEILSKLNDSGFVTVRYYNEKYEYSVLAKCEEIKEGEFDVVKYRNMLDKIRKTLISNKSLILVDFHKGNIMKLNDEYVFVDIDLNMIDMEYVRKMYKLKEIKSIMNKDIPTRFNVIQYAETLLESMGFDVNAHTFSMLALELTYISGGEPYIKLTQEVYDELKQRLSVDFS